MNLKHSLTSFLVAATALMVATPAAAQVVTPPVPEAAHTETALAPPGGSALQVKQIVLPAMASIGSGELSCHDLAADSGVTEQGCLELLDDIVSAFSRCFSCWLALLNPAMIASCVTCVVNNLIRDPDAVESFQECVNAIRKWIEERIGGGAN